MLRFPIHIMYLQQSIETVDECLDISPPTKLRKICSNKFISLAFYEILSTDHLFDGLLWVISTLEVHCSRHQLLCISKRFRVWDLG